MPQIDFSKRGQGPSQGIQPQKRNQTSFGSDYQPSTKARKAGQLKSKQKRTQAQMALDLSGYDPMSALIVTAVKYADMLNRGVDWMGNPASIKQIETYAKELTKINENLATYQSAKAPVENISVDPELLEAGDAPVADEGPLTTRELASCKRDMLNRLDRF
jgi:hypothetical protein